MKQRMHIVMLTRVLPHHSIGGMQAIAWDLARAFVRNGNKVTVVTTEVVGRHVRFVEDGVHVIALPKISWRRYGSRWWRESRRVFLRELATDCDALLSVSAAGFGLLALKAAFPDIPFVLQAHGTSLGEVRSKWKTRRPMALLSSLRNLAYLCRDIFYFPHFDAITAVGQAVADDLQAVPICWKLDSKLVHVIPNGIDSEHFRPDAASGQKLRESMGWRGVKVIVSASRLHRQKGVHLGLDAFSLLEKMQEDVRFLIVGDGPERHALEAHAEKLGLAHKVHFTGAISRDQLPQYLQAADVMLFTTTRVEGLPMNVLEALAVGLPAVVSEHLFQNDSLAENSNIFRVEQASAVAVAHAMERALKQSMSKESALPHEYSLAKCATTYLELFNKISTRNAVMSKADSSNA